MNETEREIEAPQREVKRESKFAARVYVPGQLTTHTKREMPRVRER